MTYSQAVVNRINQDLETYLDCREKFVTGELESYGYVQLDEDSEEIVFSDLDRDPTLVMIVYDKRTKELYYLGE